MRLASALLLALLAAGARAGDMEEQAARSYAVETEGSTAALPAGGRGTLILTIRPQAGAHVQAQAPLRLTLSASPGLALGRDRLKLADAIEPRAHAPRFEIGFTATAPGAQAAKARLEFFVCSDRWCVRQEREVAWVVAVHAVP